MNHSPNPQKGYSLIELLVVLIIVGILAVLGISMMGNRSGGAVRGVMDEIEGTLLEANKLATATGKDVMIVTQGDWTSTGNPLIMAFGDASLTPAQILINGATDAASFQVARSGTAIKREHLNAGIAVNGTNWWATASLAAGGKQNVDITTVAPFTVPGSTAGFMGGFKTSLTATNLLFQGSAPVAPSTNPNTTRISGYNKRFNSTFWIPIVGITNGQPIPGGPMGLIFVQNNGSTIFKFYNAGSRDGDGQWRRI